MPRSYFHIDRHLISRTGWLRAVVLGANDGIVSTASLIVGVASTTADTTAVTIAGIAGLVAGGMSMAAGEYVSVSSQADTEAADLGRETRELKDMPAAEHRELADIYIARGLEPGLANKVATQLMAKNALGTHARDELGITEFSTARPILAALSSAASFIAGAALPLIMVLISPAQILIPAVAAASLGFLALLGAIGAYVGGAGIIRPTWRVTFWGAMAMALTAGIGKLFGTVV